MWVSPYIVVVALGWLVAQGTKYIVAAIQAKSVRVFRNLYTSGNMPSAHSASAVALATLVGLKDGTGSAIFAVSLLLAAIVMYDAVMVRRSSGEQGAALQQLIQELKSTVLHPRAAKGHTPVEVLAGAVVGLLIGLIMFFCSK